MPKGSPCDSLCDLNHLICYCRNNHLRISSLCKLQPLFIAQKSTQVLPQFPSFHHTYADAASRRFVAAFLSLSQSSD